MIGKGTEGERKRKLGGKGKGGCERGERKDEGKRVFVILLV